MTLLAMKCNSFSIFFQNLLAYYLLLSDGAIDQLFMHKSIAVFNLPSINHQGMQERPLTCIDVHSRFACYGAQHRGSGSWSIKSMRLGRPWTLVSTVQAVNLVGDDT